MYKRTFVDYPIVNQFYFKHVEYYYFCFIVWIATSCMRNSFFQVFNKKTLSFVFQVMWVLMNPNQFKHTHTHTHTHICVCVCVCDLLVSFLGLHGLHWILLVRSTDQHQWTQVAISFPFLCAITKQYKLDSYKRKHNVIYIYIYTHTPSYHWSYC